MRGRHEPLRKELEDDRLLERFGETEAWAGVFKPRDSRCREGRDHRRRLKLDGGRQTREATRGIDPDVHRATGKLNREWEAAAERNPMGEVKPVEMSGNPNSDFSKVGP
jgi:hypothetical protein